MGLASWMADHVIHDHDENAWSDVLVAAAENVVGVVHGTEAASGGSAQILRPTLMMLYSTLSAMLKSLTLCLLVRWTFALHVALMQAWTLMLLTILMHMRIVISITRT